MRQILRLSFISGGSSVRSFLAPFTAFFRTLFFYPHLRRHAPALAQFSCLKKSAAVP
jgi:hypothetical protein